MKETFWETVKNNKLRYSLVFLLFIGFSVWFFYIHTFSLDSTEEIRQVWASLYQIVAILGAVIGILVSRKWGGHKSLFGKTILFFSLSLLFQSFGQSVTSYFIYFEKISTPYPSIADAGFFGSMIFYILGALSLVRVSGLRFSLKSLKGKIFAFLIPVVMLVFSYFFFLQGYEFDWSNITKIFLDFGYPLGDATYISIALLTFILCKDFLGGIMRKPVFFLSIALAFQYLADFMFLYKASRGTWYVGGPNDFLYFTSYFLMTLSLVYIGSIFDRIKNS